MDRNTSFVALALATASLGFTAQAEDPAVLPTDPPRWSVPAETPAQKYALAMKEAGAALDESRKQCRAASSAPAERKACEDEAREQWRREVREARRHLSNDDVATR